MTTIAGLIRGRSPDVTMNESHVAPYGVECRMVRYIHLMFISNYFVVNQETSQRVMLTITPTSGSIQVSNVSTIVPRSSVQIFSHMDATNPTNFLWSLQVSSDIPENYPKNPGDVDCQPKITHSGSIQTSLVYTIDC